jgi:hypothetical protein
MRFGVQLSLFVLTATLLLGGCGGGQSPEPVTNAAPAAPGELPAVEPQQVDGAVDITGSSIVERKG